MRGSIGLNFGPVRSELENKCYEIVFPCLPFLSAGPLPSNAVVFLSGLFVQLRKWTKIIVSETSAVISGEREKERRSFFFKNSFQGEGHFPSHFVLWGQQIVLLALILSFQR